VAEQRPTRHVKLGRVLGPAGVRGWLKVQSYTDPPENLLQHRSWLLLDAQGRRRSFIVAESVVDGGRVRCRFEGVEDRDAAALLGGADVEVERSALPPTAAREYYRDDLIGLRVVTVDGREFLCRKLPYTAQYLGEVTVAPVTSTVRDIPSEVLLTERDGLPRSCAVNCDHIQTVTKGKLGGLTIESPNVVVPLSIHRHHARGR